MKRMEWFHNGYGLSVIDDGYGSGTAKPFEVAVFRRSDSADERGEYVGRETFPDLFVNDQVAGWLSAREVLGLRAQVRALPPK